MKKTLALLSLLALPVAAREVWDTPVQFPPEIHYKLADKALVHQAADELRSELAPRYNGQQRLLADTVVVGPFLWQRLRQLAPFAGDPGNDVELKVSLPDREIMGHGRALKEPAAAALEVELRHELADDRGYGVRKLQGDEARLLAQLLPFDLEEPILVLDSSHHKLAVFFLDGKLVLVEDLYKARLENLRSR